MSLFLDYLIEKKILHEEQRGAWKTFIDYETKEFLIKSNILSQTKVNFLWGEYVRDNRNIEGRPNTK